MDREQIKTIRLTIATHNPKHTTCCKCVDAAHKVISTLLDELEAEGE